MNKRGFVPGTENNPGTNNVDPLDPANMRPQARSRLSNGRELLPNVDGRSLIARRYRHHERDCVRPGRR
jgi:hypothetical protein